MNPETSTVFLVDDDPVMLFLWEGILRAAGKKVEAFERPVALLKRLSPRDRGCVVVDLRMPGFDGLEFQRALQVMRATLPLIFVSGSANVPAVLSAMKGGAVDFLSKPVDPKELCAVVERALRKDAEAAAMRGELELARMRWRTLSPHEQDMCRLLAQGLGGKQIAESLRSTESAVQSQRTALLQKLHVSTVGELVRFLAHVTGEG